MNSARMYTEPGIKPRRRLLRCRPLSASLTTAASMCLVSAIGINLHKCRHRETCEGRRTATSWIVHPALGISVSRKTHAKTIILPQHPAVCCHHAPDCKRWLCDTCGVEIITV